jgi:hypothetical protein
MVLVMEMGHPLLRHLHNAITTPKSTLDARRFSNIITSINNIDIKRGVFTGGGDGA